MSTKLNAGIAFGTPIKFSGRDGIYVEFIPENHNQHKLLINWGDHPYFTQQPIHAFSVVREVAQPIADERDEYRKALDAILANWDSHLHQPEQLKSGDIGDGKTFEYWSPSGAMIDTEPIAKARAILSKYKRP